MECFWASVPSDDPMFSVSVDTCADTDTGADAGVDDGPRIGDGVTKTGEVRRVAVDFEKPREGLSGS